MRWLLCSVTRTSHMPAKLEVDREQVKCVAIQVGYREAARQFNLPPSTVLSWAERDGWSQQVEEVKRAQILKQENQGVRSVAVTRASDILIRLGDKSKLKAAKVGGKMLQAIGRKKADELVKASGAYKNTVDGLAKVHGWGSESQSQAPLVAIQVVNSNVPDA
jgi:hypothetical protein